MTNLKEPTNGQTLTKLERKYLSRKVLTLKSTVVGNA